VFSVYMRIEVDHYPAFVLSGLLPWTWFSASLSEASRSIIDNRALVKRVALPSEVFPLVSVGSNLAHFLLSLPVLLILLVASGVGLSWAILLLPVIVLAQAVLTFGIALFTSSLAVRFRDLLQIVPNLLTIWFFVTPVFYPASMVPPAFRSLLLANPMTILVGCYHDVLFYGRVPDPLALGGIVALGLLLVVAGHRVFEMRREFFVEEI